MYTQCPDCSTAFRVTAEILRQAAGKVRCGGCGNAFNALEYLSETMPEQVAPKEPEAHLPELKPEPQPGSVPTSISAEQSAALLKTLDELAGSDIRIEDTGVEWRVLDDDEQGEAAADEMAVNVEVEDQPHIDEILEDSPTPVDQFLTDTPPQVDAPEIFALDDEQASQPSVDELRFDDNTPLPDDFDLDGEAPFVPAEPEPEPQPEPVVEMASQADLDLSEPDEWTDILDEFEGIADELSGVEPAGDTDLEPSEPEPGDRDEDEVAEASVEDSIDEPLDMDSQFALQAEAMGIDLSGIHETVDEDKTGMSDDLEALLEESSEEVRDLEDLLDEELVDEDDANEETVIAGDEFDDETDDETDDDETGEESAQLELIDDEALDELEGDEEPVSAEYDEFVDELEDEEWPGDPEEDNFLDEAEFDDDVEANVEHYVPPLTEEEQTINMQIDEELLAIAVEDEDGFASTMVLPEDAAEDKASEEKTEADESTDEAEQALKDTGAGFETIIMEGEAFRSALDDDKQEEHKAAAAASLASIAEAKAATQEAERAARKRQYGIAAGIAALVLLLVGQYIHQARDSLATIPAFNSVVGPMYRAIGKPLSPDWDITGWRFEVTDGKTDDENASLAIVSRLGNRSETPLPYPIIAVSLADRFEEPLGSVTLSPGDYLEDNLDPRKLVEPGNSFQAKFVVSSLPENATTYRLRACYRAADGQLRCKEDDFK